MEIDLLLTALKLPLISKLFAPPPESRGTILAQGEGPVGLRNPNQHGVRRPKETADSHDGDRGAPWHWRIPSRRWLG